MAVPAPPGAPVALSPPFIAAMDIWKGGAQPWGWPQWLLPILDDFYGEVAVWGVGASPRHHYPTEKFPRSALGRPQGLALCMHHYE